MGSKSKSKPDYVAEIDLPCNKLVDGFSEILRKKYGLETEKVTDSTNQFLSKDRRHSFRKSVIKAVPAQIEWYVEKASPTKCRIQISFDLPLWLRIFFCAIFVGLGCLIYTASWAVTKYWKHSSKIINNPTSFIQLTICFLAVVGLAILFFMILNLCMGLLVHYVALVKIILRNICELHSTTRGRVRLKWVPGKSKNVIDWKIPVFGLCTFCCVLLLVSTRDRLIRAMFASKVCLLFYTYLTVLTCYYIAVCKTEKRYSFTLKATAIMPNFLFIFSIGLLLLAVPLIMYVWAKDTIAMCLLSAPGIEEYLSASWHGVNALPPPPTLLAKTRIQCLTMCSALVFILFLAIYVLVTSVQEFVASWSAWPAEYNKELEDIFCDETKNTNIVDRLSLNLPLKLKIPIALLFLVFSVSCWAGVLINLSLLNAFITPEFRLMPFAHGEIIVKGTMLMAGAMFGQLEDNGGVQVLHFFLIVPAIFPFGLFIFLNVRASILSHLKTRSLISIKGDITTKTNSIAAQMGVSNVLCLLNNQSNLTSPYAVVRGWPPRRMVVFTPRGLVFLANHPDHAEAIIAHEVAHLKHDCLRLWKLRLLSRLSLLGTGFLSFLHNSIAIEDRADDDARRYLRVTGKNENLLTEAAVMLEAQDYRDNKFYSPDQQISAAFSPLSNTNNIGSAQIRLSFFKRIYAAFRIAHDVYFLTDLPDYIHRVARYRRTQPDPKRT